MWLDRQIPCTIEQDTSGTEEEQLNLPGEQNTVDNLLHSPLGVFVLIKCLIEVSGTAPGMPSVGYLVRHSPAEDLARWLQTLSTREVRLGCFDALTTERLSELIGQCGPQLTPY
jgi:hypothetical protein